MNQIDLGERENALKNLEQNQRHLEKDYLTAKSEGKIYLIYCWLKFWSRIWGSYFGAKFGDQFCSQIWGSYFVVKYGGHIL